jgi:ribosomal peptide maturation radical SAM protein 1
MPFGALDSPSLALGLLKAGLGRIDVDCDVSYLNLAFASRLGIEPYRRITEGLPQRLLAPDWVFSGTLFEAQAQTVDGYVGRILRAQAQLDEEDVEIVLAARSQAAAFLSGALEELPWSSYDLVGFTCGGQTIPSLALAKLVKQRHPGVLTVFGGPGWHGAMGKTLFSVFPFVDAACIGDGDRALPSLVRAVAEGDREAAGRIPGMLVRGSHAPGHECAGQLIDDLDELPIPDYAGFAAARADSLPSRDSGVRIPLETSRGCWWASRGPCNFCGVIGPRRTYRAKSAERILSELRTLAAQPGCTVIELNDSVAAPALLSTVLAQLSLDPLPTPLDLDIRPEVSRRVIELLAENRATILTGIESLSDHVLALMNKGTHILENVRLLKWCRAAGVPVRWNLLYGLPGETSADYDDVMSVLQAISHLDPPSACGPIIVERFSPFFEDPESYGFTNVRPATAYRYLYPFGDDTLAGLAYFFDHDYLPELEPPGRSHRLRRLIHDLSETAPQSGLRIREGDVVVDSRRPEDTRTYQLDDLERTIFAACDDIRDRTELEEDVRRSGMDGLRLTERIDEALAWFVERDLMLRRDDRFLSLALPSSAPVCPTPATEASETEQAQLRDV